ncbi:adenosylmethionine--8-amino-7-oxononanoate transaminase [Hydrogenophaga borbori]|uniref:adenosylmethionine--8-amino-7-oxononanoate transaminase n=1 Tax=Hydrogenophaga borbori TaxID=2294117 RepID=UPI00301D6B21
MTNNGSAMPELAARSLARVWHPCTSMARAAQHPPLPLARGEGPWLFDSEGRRYFDAISSWWVNLFGHSDEGLRAAITAQLNTLPHAMLAGCTHEPVVRLAERLCARSGGALAHASFGSDGASAVELALKQSFHAWRNQGLEGKRGFVALRGGYHGETLGALSVTDVAIFRDAYDPLLMRSRLVDAPDSRLGNEDQALAALAALLAREADQLAAVLIEPLVQGAAGMVMHAPRYLRELRRLCTAHGVHLIADEIAVGCGRTGRFFAWSHTEPAGPADWPDFLLLSKGITGGTLPLSVVLSGEAVFRAFWSDDPARAFLHSHSYTGNPLACAAANAVLDRFDAGQEARCAEQAAWLAQAFAPLAQDDRVAHLRQRGTILAFDLPGAAADVAERFHLAGRAHGLLIRPIGRTVYLMPPYLVDPPTAAWLAEAVTDTLNDVV